MNGADVNLTYFTGYNASNKDLQSCRCGVGSIISEMEAGRNVPRVYIFDDYGIHIQIMSMTHPLGMFNH